MRLMVKSAADEIIAKQYCANGGYQDWLTYCANQKFKRGRLNAITTNEWQALIAESKSFRESIKGKYNDRSF